MTIHVSLTPEQEQRLQEAARTLNISAEALASAAIRDLLAQAGTDFERAAHRVLDKKSDLYRRLA